MSATQTSEWSSQPARAWAPYQPDAKRPWDPVLAGHLYRRAAFGATWAQLQQALADGPQATVSKLLQPQGDAAAFDRASERYESAAARANAAEAFVAWWLRRLLDTPHPLQEQMTLFWHNHFALSNAAVNSPALMSGYLRLLRRESLGRFDLMLQALLGEPALFAGLEARANRKARPNRHLARILIEQYTVGPGVCSEQDAGEAARALTGWFVTQDQLQFHAYEHDAGTKKVLGQEGAFDAKDIARLLLGHPATSRWVVARLYRWFISETEPAPPALVTPLATEFARDFNIARLVETMLRSNLFFSPAAIHQKVKSPLEFVLSLVKPMEGSLGTLRLGGELAALGQDLLEPPTSKGWAGQRYWINSFTLIGRARLAQALLTPDGPHASKLDPATLAGTHGQLGPEAAGSFLCQLLFQNNLPDAVRRKALEAGFDPKADTSGDPAKQLRHLAAQLTALPEFHLA